MAHPAPHPRTSLLSTGSSRPSSIASPPPTSPPSSIRERHPSTLSQLSVPLRRAPSLGYPTNLDRPLNRLKGAEVALGAWAFLYAEIVAYSQARVDGIAELERKLNTLGHRVGARYLELLVFRSEGMSKAPKRETRLLPVLHFIHTTLWKALFNKPADALEKSREAADEYMISDNTPPLTRSISIPSDLSSLSCEAFTAGIVEAVLDGLGFPARVTAHSVPAPGYPQRTTILVKFNEGVMEREEALGQGR